MFIRNYFFSELHSLSLRAQQHANIEQIMVCERLGLLQDVLLSHRDLCDRLEKGIAQDHQNALAKMLSLKKRKMQGVIRGADVCYLNCFQKKFHNNTNFRAKV